MCGHTEKFGNWLVAPSVCLNVNRTVYFTLCHTVHHCTCVMGVSVFVAPRISFSVSSLRPFHCVSHCAIACPTVCCALSCAAAADSGNRLLSLVEISQNMQIIKLYLSPVAYMLRNWLGTTTEGGGEMRRGGARWPNVATPTLLYPKCQWGLTASRGQCPLPQGKMPCGVLYRSLPLVTDACYTWGRKNLKCTSAGSRITCELTLQLEQQK